MFFGLNVAAVYCHQCQAGTLCVVIWVWVVCITAAFIGAQRVRLGPSGSEKTERVKYSCQRLRGAWLKQEVIIIPAWASESLKCWKEVWIMAQYVFNPFSARTERKRLWGWKGCQCPGEARAERLLTFKVFSVLSASSLFPEKKVFCCLETWTKDTIF